VEEAPVEEPVEEAPMEEALAEETKLEKPTEIKAGERQEDSENSEFIERQSTSSTEEDIESVNSYEENTTENKIKGLNNKETGCIYFHESLGANLVPFWCIKSRNHFTEI
jgi:hypothetical protein